MTGRFSVSEWSGLMAGAYRSYALYFFSETHKAVFRLCFIVTLALKAPAEGPKMLRHSRVKLAPQPNR